MRAYASGQSTAPQHWFLSSGLDFRKFRFDEKVQDSDFFARTFDAVIAVGLLFLLPEPQQYALIARIGNILAPGGHCLLMAPTETGAWKDTNTGIKCLSLGQKRYEKILKESNMRLLDTYEDAGKNNYYAAENLRWQPDDAAAWQSFGGSST